MKVLAGIIWLAVMTLAAAPGAWATLGESAASIQKDKDALSAVAKGTIAHGKYSVQELVSGANEVREYVTPSGVVFAVAWNGLVHPDLKVLLGTYDAEYRDALCRQERTQGRRQTRVASERLVVETWGHMRNLQGRAYLPSMVPEGVNLNEIR